MKAIAAADILKMERRSIERLRRFKAQLISAKETESFMEAREDRITKLIASESEFLSQMHSPGISTMKLKSDTPDGGTIDTPLADIAAIRPVRENRPNTDSTSQ